ncbi:MIF4G like-domain-containing protein [Clohesyomyces aquaticus]|uniref:MIF4G like-domain-containing protein n=1 Tax=Clohesyomyces aquaticus TaxID=1231657 RepID=A0A1Y1YIV7_9PLEO|nr:MIF4G like-domain-containing protein [Clohesyomyces aquaticus]
MAEGGRNRGGNSRKRDRRHDDDGEPERHGHQQKRRREESTSSKIRRMMLNIAASDKLPQDEAQDIARLLGESLDDEAAMTEFFDTLVQLIIEQPFRIPHVAAVAFFANDDKPEITAQAVKRVGTKTQEMLRTGQWTEFKLLLRFLACLQSLYNDDGVFTLLNQLFDTIVDLQSANENDVVGLELVKIILLTIPYAVASAGSTSHGKASELLEKTGIVAANRLPIESLVELYVADSTEKPFPYYSAIGMLQTQLEREAELGWKFACIPRFARYIPRKLGDAEPMEFASQLHAFPSFAVPSPVNPGTKLLFPEAYFSLYADTPDFETVPKTTDIAASLLRDAIVDTINQLDFNRDAAARTLVELDNFWALPTFAPRGTPPDKLEEIAPRVPGWTEGQTLWKSEDMIIDAIFSQLLKLPGPEHKLVYYHALITESCKIAPAAIAPSLGRAIRFVYGGIDILDLELVHRFCDWFSHHLSNFEFRWRWQEWTENLEHSPLHPKKAFIIAALDKEIRLSFAKRIRTTVPKEYHPLIPAAMDEDKSPDFKYENPQTPFSPEGVALLHQIRKKAPDSEIQETIDKIHKQALEQGIVDVLVPSTDAFVTAICRLGSKSLSHVLSCIERGKERLMSIANTSETARRQVVASVVEYWKDQPGIAVNIIDKLINYQILQPSTVIEWALVDHLGAGDPLTKDWVFELVYNTIAKVTSRTRQIVTARLQKGLPQEQIKLVDDELTKDRERSRELFKLIADSISGVAEGSADGLIEKETSGELTAEEGQFIREWAKRWHMVFVRKAQVEESVVGEEAVDARIRLLALEPELEPEPEAMVEGNGVAEDVANVDEEML